MKKEINHNHPFHFPTDLEIKTEFYECEGEEKNLESFMKMVKVEGMVETISFTQIQNAFENCPYKRKNGYCNAGCDGFNQESSEKLIDAYTNGISIPMIIAYRMDDGGFSNIGGAHRIGHAIDFEKNLKVLVIPYND